MSTGRSGRHPAAKAQRTSPRTPGARGHASAEAATFSCDLCGAEMLDLHCKLVCNRCGYKRDCSDP